MVNPMTAVSAAMRAGAASPGEYSAEHLLRLAKKLRRLALEEFIPDLAVAADFIESCVRVQAPPMTDPERARLVALEAQLTKAMGAPSRAQGAAGSPLLGGQPLSVTATEQQFRAYQDYMMRTQHNLTSSPMPSPWDPQYAESILTRGKSGE